MVIRLDPRYGSIGRLSWSRLSIAAGDTKARGGTLSRTTAKTCSRVSLDWGGEREEGVDDAVRREASLVTSATSVVGYLG